MSDTDGSVFGDAPKRLRRFARWMYVSMLLITFIIALAALGFGETRDLVLTIPVIVVLAMTIFTERKTVHIPPALIIMMCLTFYISTAGRIMLSLDVMSDVTLFMLVVNFLVGVNFGLLSLILVYMFLKTMPGVRNENPMLVTFFVMAASVAIYIFLRMIQYYIAVYWAGMEQLSLSTLMDETLMVVLGSAVVCLLYYEDDKHNLFKYTLDSFLEINSEALGIQDRERENVLKLIEGGESEKLEFKSTLRTNLETGETDKRMEKAVLKTIVAFLNSSGGNLLIGVSDDGSICGADLESFDNKDKMGLHLTNLISSKIGNGFLPYITFNLIDFDDRVVIRVRCDPCPIPVFYKDGKIEIFYVRSGPRTEELTGTTLLGYVKNRENDKNLKKIKKRFSDAESAIPILRDEGDGDSGAS